MKKKALVVCNSKSGHHRGQKKVKKVVAGISDLYDVDVYISEFPKSITKKIKEEGENYDLVVTMGGDGTINEAITGILQIEKRPKMAFVPMGTCNDVCHTYKYKNIKTVIRRIHEGNTQDIDCFKVNDGYFIYAFAVGSVSSVTYASGGSKKFLGKLFYYIRGGAGIFKKSRIPYEMGDIKSEAYVFVVINSKHLGGFNIKTNHLNDGKLHMYIVDYNKHKNGAFDFGLLMVLGKKSKITHLYEGDSFHLTLGKEMAFNTDGELLAKYDHIDLSVLPKAITIF